jgi:hypothetical protein
MRYVVAIEKGDKRHAYGVVVPDLPGCFSAGDTLDEALSGTDCSQGRTLLGNAESRHHPRRARAAFAQPRAL